jgi:succinoglycan biosynthesis transport protein ExoP
VENKLTGFEQGRLIAALNAKYTVINKLRSRVRNVVESLFSDDKQPINKVNDGKKLQISDAYGWLTRAIGSDLTVEPVFNTRIVKVSYESTNPQIAAIMANRFTEAYLTTNLKMMIDPARKTKVWFDDQLKALRRRLEEAQSTLTEYQQEEGIVFSDERLDTETTRLQKLSSQLVASQQTTRNVVIEQQELDNIVASGASLTTFPTVLNNSVIQKIKSEIRILESKLVELSSKLGSKHPERKKVGSELYAARARLNAEVDAITESIRNAAELSRERERDLTEALELQKQLVLDLKQERNRISVYVREVESAESTYNAALKLLNTTSMQSVVDQANVSIVDRANIPRRHSSPSVMKNLALGGVGGVIVAIGFLVAMNMIARRVHSRDELVDELGVPVLGQLIKC